MKLLQPNLQLVLTFLAVWSFPVQAIGQTTKHIPPPTAALDETFSVITAMVELASGKVVLLDRTERRIVVADFDTQRITEPIRNGSGPNEVAYATRLVATPGGGAAVADAENERLLLLDGAGTPSGFWQTGTDDALIRSTMRLSGHPGQARTVVLERTDRSGVSIFRWDPTSANLTPLHRRASRQTPPVGTAGGPAVGRASDRIVSPFPTLPDLWMADTAGWTFVVQLAPYRAIVIAPDGRTVEGPIQTARPYRIDDATKRATTAELAIQRAGQMNASTAFEWPDILPPFHTDRFPALFIATDGTLWVRRTTPATEPPRFDVFDRTGNLKGIVRLPHGYRLAALGRRHVYLVSRDSDGSETVHRAPFSF
ncbi:MAG: hypothetical protein KF689_07870 [Gemmatimonadaceae bacterium]|nr:hypothetical protein [Gemmatimonadaceae bacterium]MCW5824912.1 hypothetical protein [Gemmatimonadaceae bacterium]